MFKLTRFFLICAFCAPLLYFGNQFLAALFYPNYNFIRLVASDLGSPSSSFPIFFNLGAMLGGIVTILGSLGYWLGLVKTRTSRVLMVLLCLAVVFVGLSSLWAGLYPLPDLRHGQNPFALLGFLPMPFLVALVFWYNTPLRVYLGIFVVFLLLLMPVMSGVIAVDRSGIEGLLQRILALVTFTPIAVGAACLLWQNKTA